MSSQKPKKPFNHYIVLTGIALQMGITVYLASWLGKWLDRTYNPDGRAYTIVLTLLGVGIALFNVLRQTNKLNK